MDKIANRNMDFDERIRCQNIAEDFFENQFNYINRDSGSWCYKYGIDSEKSHDKNLRNVKSLILNTPDFLCWDNTTREFNFVEVKHCGYNLYLKQAHFDNYKKWDKCHDVFFWIYQSEQKIAYLSINKLDSLIANNEYDTTKFHDCDKVCWVIPFNDLLV